MFKSKSLTSAALAIAAIAIATPALAQDAAAPAANQAYLFNTLLFLLGGILVVWMAAGFAMLEAGMVQAKNVSMQCLKNIALYSIAGLMFWLIGYNVMYEGVDGGFIGTFLPKVIPDTAKDAGDYTAASDWFFQMAF